MTPRPHHPTALRVQALTLLTEGFPLDRVHDITSIPPRTLQYIRKKAKDRGYDPKIDRRILEEYVIDGHHTGRPKEITEETELGLIESVSKD